MERASPAAGAAQRGKKAGKAGRQAPGGGGASERGPQRTTPSRQQPRRAACCLLDSSVRDQACLQRCRYSSRLGCHGWNIRQNTAAARSIVDVNCPSKFQSYNGGRLWTL